MSAIDAFAAALLGEAAFIETIPGTELRPSSVHGRGLFTKRAWARGEVLCVLDGQRVNVVEHPPVMDALEWNALSTELLLVRPLRTSYGFINHSLQPNLAIDLDGVTLRALVDVAIDQELTLDYFAEPVPPAYLASAEARRLRS